MRACAGNMAHLLNHSCEPNSYSRTVSVRCPDTGTLSDHVVIFAKRAIAAGEELTYDYRRAPSHSTPHKVDIESFYIQRRMPCLDIKETANGRGGCTCAL